MTWQDWILSIGGLLFWIALIPTIRGREKPPIFTSALTAAVLTVFLVPYVSLHLWLTSISGTLSAACWWILMAQVMLRNRQINKDIRDIFGGRDE